MAATAKASAIDGGKAHGHHVVDQLEHMAMARRADVEDVLAEGLQHGLQRLKSSGSAPTMVLSRPSSASLGVRASGASMSLMPLAAKSARIFALEAGSAVEVSTTIRPARPRRAGHRSP